MKFPDSDRVIYGKNPLAEVVCQLSFPRILALDDRLPADFQIALGKAYPFVEIKNVVEISIGAGGSNRVQYEFLNEERSVKVSVCSDFLAISTTHYECWEAFRTHIDAAITALQSSYPIAMFTRIGLRYLDVISRNRLGLKEVLWSDLIRQSALGLLAEDDIPTADLNETGSITTMKIDGGNVTCRYGLAKTEATGEESVFIVDTDFYASVPLKEVKHASDLLDKFNRSAGQAFRWFICPKLHDALGPKRPD